ncbi:alpha/beta fold hydrolase [Pseudoruegeria sp. SK021]|uniref:alpha/beta fold hydrolase n=1 Tax=Pseudoruegeria sp. SK021 TaxID=1933035 RepID=UPI000A23BE4B|nr:alpha/beta hydrolase [Pseudoruegeria sp. SK021]OSP55271.1 hypothetical protein BV911_08585 [Pseudoruegeria sp. SK021]
MPDTRAAPPDGPAGPQFQTAPFHHVSAQAPSVARAVWTHTKDGTRLRLGLLGRGTHGTVLLLQGRTEYLEKYGRVARRFADLGYGMVSVDFRGQGLSDRPLPDAQIGHVSRFADYQQDVAELVAFAQAEAMPRPWFLLAHSLGGAIGLRALRNKLDVAAAVFSAPMWGINVPSALRPLTYGLGWIAHTGQLNAWITPGMSRKVYAATADPSANLLTHDPEGLAYMQAHLTADPALGLGAPSLAWVYQAMMECRSLRHSPSPPVPSLTFLPTGDKVVSQHVVRSMIARWPNARLVDIPDGAHETMMETAARQDLFFSSSAEFFNAHRAKAITAQQQVD